MEQSGMYKLTTLSVQYLGVFMSIQSKRKEVSATRSPVPQRAAAAFHPSQSRLNRSVESDYSFCLFVQYPIGYLSGRSMKEQIKHSWA